MCVIRVSTQKKNFQVGKASLTLYIQDSLLRHFKRRIPNPDEAGIGSMETEAGNKETEKLQSVNPKRNIV